MNVIKSNDIATVRSLLADGSVDANARISNVVRSPLLVHAAGFGHVEMVALLLDAGAQIDSSDDFGHSACHFAVNKAHTAVVELLIARNANVTLRNGSNLTPIQFAISKKNEGILMLLIDASIAAGTLDDESICHAATFSVNVLRSLLFKYRIDLSAVRATNGRTPLHEALWGKRDAMSMLMLIDMLIEVGGVDVDARDETGRTAAHLACIFRDGDVLARLIAAGVDLGIADIHGNTSLHHCEFHTTDQIACMLLAAGANVHARNDRGQTTCHEACKQSSVSLPALVAFGANLDEPDNDGVTSRQLLKSAPPTTEEVELARRRVFSVQLSLVRGRAFEVCVGLQSRGIDALCMCEILLHSCGPVAPFVPFHRWWQIATKVKHWQQ